MEGRDHILKTRSNITTEISFSMTPAIVLHQGEGQQPLGQARLPRHARRLRLDQGGDRHRRLQRRHQDERRHRHPVGLLDRPQGLLREEQGVPPGTGGV